MSDYPNISPVGPLPWTLSEDDPCMGGDVVVVTCKPGPRYIRTVCSFDECDFVAGVEDAAYAATACTLYPELRERVAELEATVEQLTARVKRNVDESSDAWELAAARGAAIARVEAIIGQMESNHGVGHDSRVPPCDEHEEHTRAREQGWDAAMNEASFELRAALSGQEAS